MTGANNPIVKSVLIAWLFWYSALFLLLAGYFGVGPWRVLEYMAYACVVMGAGATIGMSVVLAMQAASAHVTELGVRAGDSMRMAKVNLGRLPSPASVPARSPSKAIDALLASQAWWEKLADSFPLHAKAIRAVLEVMHAEPRLPASPVPGGHGGRTLIEHSMAVANEILMQAKGWVYEGQRDKRGVIRVRAASPHRFSGRDVGLLVLAGLAHDIGKIRCYKPDGRPAAPNMPLTVTEIRPNHDTEGARLLRSVPEILDLPYDDRTALLTAVGYYHHAYSLPLSAWVTDRIRSLTELLVKTDLETGRKEGHTLTHGHAAHAADQDQPETGLEYVEDEGADGDARVYGANLDGVELLEDEGEVLAALAKVRAKPAKQAAPSRIAESTQSATPPAEPPAERIPFEIDVAMQILRRPGAINGGKTERHVRCAWKSGDHIYVMEKTFRAQCQTHPSIPTNWVTGGHMEPVNGNMAAFTGDVLRYFAKRGELVMQHGETQVVPERALWRVKVPKQQEDRTLVVFILRTKAVPGADTLSDASPMEIICPFWGAQSSKKASPLPQTKQPAPAPEEVEKKPETDALVANIPRRSAPKSDPLADMPLDMLGLNGAEASDEAVDPAAERPQDSEDDRPDTDAHEHSEADQDGTESAQADSEDEAAALTQRLFAVLSSPEFSDEVTYKEKNGRQFAVIRKDSPGGQVLMEMLTALEQEGKDISEIKIAKQAGTGEKIITIPKEPA